jgi:hypothetical protein
MPAPFKYQLGSLDSVDLNVPLLVDARVAAHRHNKPGPSVGCIDNARECLEHCGVNASAGLRKLRKELWGKHAKRGGRRNGARFQGDGGWGDR